ncbi:hypothetical protein [Acidovorax sp.]|uniref:hypothetical protein n=1 Tax=Acidovorax sp. TaxID=1872122 RepID=UPI00391A0145
MKGVPRAYALALCGCCAGLVCGSVLAGVQAQAAAGAEPVAPPMPAAPPALLAPAPADAAQRARVEALRAAASAVPTPGRTPAPLMKTPAQRDAAWLLGLLALHGLGMPPDAPQAQHWFERAQALGHSLAPAGLAWCALQGCGTGQPNPVLARPWLEPLRRADPGRAQFLEWLVEQQLAPLGALGAPPGPAPVVVPHAAGPAHALSAATDARTLLRAAAQSGNAQALNELGLELLAAGRLHEALAQFNAAAPRSDAARANAQLLGQRLQASTAAAAGPARHTAHDWLLQAQSYHRGDGVPANYSEAVRLYQIAASAGDATARRMLQLIFSRAAPGGQIDVAWMQQLATAELAATTGPAAAPATLPRWQRDPTPLWDLVPLEWRSTAQGVVAAPAMAR